MAGTVEETGQTRALRIDWQQHVVYLGFLAIFVFFAVMLRDPSSRASERAMPTRPALEAA